MSRNFQTYPNQKVICVNKPNYSGDYLTVGNNEWIEASKNLKPKTFNIYLYLASNANGFNMALSRQDIMNKLGIAKNSYHNGIEELENKGYLKQRQGNVYDFYTNPTVNTDTESEENDNESDEELEDDDEENKGMYHSSGTVCTSTVVHDIPVQWDSMYHSSGTEINNTYKTNNTSNGADAPKERESYFANAKEKRDLSDLDYWEWEELLDDYKEEMKYNEIREKYNLKRNVKLDKTLGDTVQELMDNCWLEDYGCTRDEALEMVEFYNIFDYGYHCDYGCIGGWLDTISDMFNYIQEKDYIFEDELERCRKHKEDIDKRLKEQGYI